MPSTLVSAVTSATSSNCCSSPNNVQPASVTSLSSGEWPPRWVSSQRGSIGGAFLSILALGTAVRLVFQFVSGASSQAPFDKTTRSRRSAGMVSARRGAGARAGLGHRDRGEPVRELIGRPGRERHFGERGERDAEVDVDAAIDDRAGGGDRAAVGGDDVHRFARRAAGGDDVLNYQKP